MTTSDSDQTNLEGDLSPKVQTSPATSAIGAPPTDLDGFYIDDDNQPPKPQAPSPTKSRKTPWLSTAAKRSLQRAERITTESGYVMHRGGDGRSTSSEMYLETNHHVYTDGTKVEAHIQVRVGSLPWDYPNLEENGAKLTLDQARDFAKWILDSVALAEESRRKTEEEIRTKPNTVNPAPPSSRNSWWSCFYRLFRYRK